MSSGKELSQKVYQMLDKIIKIQGDTAQQGGADYRYLDPISPGPFDRTIFPGVKRGPPLGGACSSYVKTRKGGVLLEDDEEVAPRRKPAKKGGVLLEDDEEVAPRRKPAKTGGVVVKYEDADYDDDDEPMMKSAQPRGGVRKIKEEASDEDQLCDCQKKVKKTTPKPKKERSQKQQDWIDRVRQYSKDQGVSYKHAMMALKQKINH